MREIKFRAWDEGNKIMHSDFQFITSGKEGNDWIVFESDKEKRQTLREDTIIFNNPFFRQQLKIMQFTGLKDKNGKEIYEGDIVQIKEITHKRLIGFENSIFEVRFLRGSFMCIRKKQGIKNEEYLGALHSYNCLEVIGNIYEAKRGGKR